MADRPLVGVTGPRTRLPWGWWATRRIVAALGGRPVHLMPGDSMRLRHRFDAVIIGGGDDIDAALYGAENHELSRLDPERDAFEVGIIESALEEGIPLLGICRGAQLINVVRGGTLFGDIRGDRHLTSNRRSPWPSKTARILADSTLARIMDPHHRGADRYRINSLHHQAIDRVGDGLRVVAHDADDFVQAVESAGSGFILGVQWHPEYLPYLAAQRRLFRALLAAAREPGRRDGL